MAEQLLTKKEAAKRFGLCLRTFDQHRPRLIANGLQVVKVGKWVMFREASIDRVIREAAERGTAL
jgi:predicted nicotinamide N-methyase